MLLDEKRGEVDIEKDMLMFCGALLLVALVGVGLFASSYASFDAITGRQVKSVDGLVSDFELDDAVVDEVEVALEPTYENALNALMRSEEDLNELSGYDLTLFLINDTLRLAKRSFAGHNIARFRAIVDEEEDGAKKRYLESVLQLVLDTPVYEIEKQNYSRVLVLTNFVEQQKVYAYRVLDITTLVEEKEEALRLKGVNTSRGGATLAEAGFAFREERYLEAEELLKRADLELTEASVETKRKEGLLRLSKNFFMLYWWQTLLVLIILVLLLPTIVTKVRRRVAKDKRQKLKLELKTLERLMKNAQEDYFNKRIISETTYKVRMDKYRNRKAEIKHTLPVLDSIVTGKKVKPVERKKWKVLEVKFNDKKK